MAMRIQKLPLTQNFLLILLFRSALSTSFTYGHTISNTGFELSSCSTYMLTDFHLMIRSSPPVLKGFKLTRQYDDTDLNLDNESYSLATIINGRVLSKDLAIITGNGSRIINYVLKTTIHVVEANPAIGDTTKKEVRVVDRIKGTNYFSIYGNDQTIRVYDFISLNQPAEKGYFIDLAMIQGMVSQAPYSTLVFIGRGQETDSFDYTSSTVTSRVVNLIGKSQSQPSSINLGRNKFMLLICDATHLFHASTVDSTITGKKAVMAGCKTAGFVHDSPLFYCVGGGNVERVDLYNINSMDRVATIPISSGIVTDLCFNPYKMLFAGSSEESGNFLFRIHYFHKISDCFVANCGFCLEIKNYCSVCKKGLFVQNGTCVQSCSSNKYLDNYSRRCVEFCPEGHSVVNGICETGCSAGQPYFQDYECVSSCSSGKFLQNDLYCVNDCNRSFLKLEIAGQQTKCLKNCPDGYYGEFHSRATCKLCDTNCLTCFDGSISCTSCHQNKPEKYLQGTNCRTSCNEGFYADETNVCQACNPTCKTCQGSATNCTSCKLSSSNPHFKNNECLASCGDKFYPNPTTKVCESCHSSCQTCTTGTECTSCITSKPYFYSNNTCVDQCSSNCVTCIDRFDKCTSCKNGEFLNSADSKCYPCDSTCQTCVNTAVNCLTCSSSFTNPYKEPVTNLCYDCMERCTSCNNHKGTCLSCKPEIKCKLPSSKLVISNCKCCYEHCSDCTGEGHGNCLKFNPGFQQIGGFCWRICPPDLNLQKEPNTCGECDSVCKTCDRMDSKRCLSCFKRGVILGDSCLDCSGFDDKLFFPSLKLKKCINCLYDYLSDPSACHITKLYQIDIKERKRKDRENFSYSTRIGLTGNEEIWKYLKLKNNWKEHFGFRIDLEVPEVKTRRRMTESEITKIVNETIIYAGRGIVNTTVVLNQNLTRDENLKLYVRNPLIVEDEIEIPMLVVAKKEKKISLRPVIKI